MATKKDLQQAQTYSHQRVLTAFISGIPGGKELEPSNPMRTVVAAIALAVLLALGSVIFGLIQPSLPAGWDHNKMVISQDTGARYITKNKVLYPVLNTTSARLLIPADEFEILTIDEDRIKDEPRGGMIGIAGAPDELPTTERLVQTGWSSCVIGGGQVTVLDPTSSTEPVAGGTVAELDGTIYLVDGTHSYALTTTNPDAVLRQLQLSAIAPVTVTARWLDLFTVGSPLTALSVPGKGTQVSVGSQSLPAGTVVHSTSDPEETRFVITEAGSVASLDPFAWSIYALSNGSEVVDVSPTDIQALPNAAEGLIPADWPHEIPAAVDLSESGACATLDTTGDTPLISLGTATDPDSLGEASTSVIVAPASGAIVQAVATDDPNNGQYALIDGTGTSFPIPDATTDILASLGFDAKQVARVPEAWLDLFPTGPSLTVAAAGSAPVGPEIPAGGTTTTPADNTAGPTVTVDGSMTGGVAGASSSIRSTTSADADGSCTAGEVVLSAETPPSLAVLQAAAAGSIATGKGVLVAVVDSGVDATNVHFPGATVLPGVNLVPDGVKDGRTDENGHGTAIAGLIAAQTFPKSGVVGLAPDAQILPVRVFSNNGQQDIEAGNGPDIDRVAQGIRWAADKGAQVINVSLSDTTDAPSLREAVAFATERGSLVVASAGNANTSTDPNGTPRYPAAYDEVLGVTATDDTLTVTDSSIHGPQVDVAAPGAQILTSATGAGDCTYATDAGVSSFATGYASAAAALVVQAFPTATPSEWMYRLQATASRAQPDFRDDVSGWGLIQPYEALTAVLDGTTRGPENPTAVRVTEEVTSAPPVTVDHITSPLAATQTVTLWIAVIGGTILLVLVLVARLRADKRHREDPAATAE